MNASNKWLKNFLMPEFQIFGLASLILKLGEFLLFDGFLDLAKFWDLDNFSVFDNFLLFDFTDFWVKLSHSTPRILLAVSSLLATSTWDDTVFLALT